MQSRGLDDGCSLFWLPCTDPLPPTCVMENSVVPFLQLGVCKAGFSKEVTEVVASALRKSTACL